MRPTCCLIALLSTARFALPGTAASTPAGGRAAAESSRAAGRNAIAADAFSPRGPDTIPTCPAPQPAAPPQLIGGSQLYSNVGTAVVWNGREYAVAWIENGFGPKQLKFRRLFADGSPDGPIALIGPGVVYPGFRPSLVWNGSGYGVAWSGQLTNPGHMMVWFARLNEDGSPVAAANNPEVVSFYGATQTAQSLDAALAWSGSQYAVVWTDDRELSTSGYDVDATLLDADGTVANGGLSHDLVIARASSSDSQTHDIAWSAARNRFTIAYAEGGAPGIHSTISLSSLYPNGSHSNPQAYPGAGTSFAPSLVEDGSGVAMAWRDYRDGNWEIYFAPLDGLLTPDLRITSDINYSGDPELVWTGGEYGVFWGDLRSGTYEIWFQRVDSGGAAVGPNVRLTRSADMGLAPHAAFGRRGYLLTTIPYYGIWRENYALPVACVDDATPPSCPANLLAYGVSGTTASVSWSPSGDPETDLAYYQVYRNNSPVGQTSGTAYNDSGLAPGSVNNYMIQPVNAWQLQNYACTGSIYVTANANLILKLGKADPDAALSWTDAGFNHYNLFRGTDPRIMQQTGSTPALSAQDPNALHDAASYFYTVDDPGR